MPKAAHILGMNARNQYYGAMNPPKARARANSKLATKRYLTKANIPVPQLYAVIRNREQLSDFSFLDIDTSFVIKPTGGSGGKGILILRKPKNRPGEWLGSDGEKYDERDLRLHAEDILEGQYSSVGTQSRAFVEERVPVHQVFKKYVAKGVPDIRIIVFNSVPIMAMLRLPTKESGGRANLHQGGIGIGIDIATGITLKGVHHGKKVGYLPGTKIKLNGIKIPHWKRVLEVAVGACSEVGLVFAGVDILIHPEKGPVVIELNARPGLEIQVANNAGLRFRLEKIEGLQIRSVDHGIRVGKALFAEKFADKVKARDGVEIIDYKEDVKIIGANKQSMEVEATIDTNSYRTKIDRTLADKLGLLHADNVLWERNVGKSKTRVIEATFYLKDKKITTGMSVVSRAGYKDKVLIGRADLTGFLVNPQREQ